MTKIDLRFSRSMDQRHEHLLLQSHEFPYRILHLRVFTLVAHLPDPFVDPLGGVALFLRQAFVFFDDLSDPLKVGANLWLWTSLPQSIPWGLGIHQYLL